jgi:hypothetical protein
VRAVAAVDRRAAARGRSRSRPRDGSGQSGATRARCLSGRHGPAAPRARSRNRSADSGSRGPATATASSGKAGSAGSGDGPPTRPLWRARPCAPMNAGKRRGQIVEQALERPCQDCRPCHDDVVIARFGRARQDGARRLTQTPASPIAGHRLTNPPAGRKAQTEIARVATLGRRSQSRLQHEGRSLPASPSGRRVEKLAPPLQLHDPGLRLPVISQVSAGTAASQADSRLRPLARRRAMMRRPPTVAMRARKPCRRLRIRLLG